MCLFNISAKKEGPSFEGGHLSFSCIDSAIVEAQTVTKKVAIRTGCIPSIKKLREEGKPLFIQRGTYLTLWP